MKSILQTLTIVLLALSLNAQTYINQAATGNNDGSSWQDAYTNPQDAFNNAITNDEIWIAAGTYKPQINALPDSNWYYIDKALTIYGGFAGTETSLDQRDWEANPTIWDADILGDDTPNDFQNNRDDNAFHLLVAEIVGGTLTLDGLTITSGNALSDELPPNVTDGRPYRGAVDLRGNGIIRNCTFQQSIANAGGGLFVVPDTFAIQTALTIENCDFVDNMGLFGVGLIVQVIDNLMISDCSFSNNTGQIGVGSLLATIASLNVSNCTFENNEATNAGGLYAVAVANGEVSNSTFTNNFGEFWGGGLSIGNSNLTVSDCVFQENEVPGSTIGAGVFIFQNPFNFFPNPTVNLNNCNFLENTAGVGAGIGFNNFFPGSNINVDSCYFFENESNFGTNNGGAAIILQNFQDNSGAVIPDLSASISNSIFEGNESYTGGAAFFYNVSSTFNLEILNSEFTDNFSETEGGGIYSFGNGSFINATVENTVFHNNEATDGSVIGNDGNTDTKLINVLAHENPGAVAIFNRGNMDLINCTIVDNNGGINNLGNSTMSLQNTILANSVLDNLGTEDNITSLGGNISNDLSLLNALQGFDNYPDFTETDPLLDSDFIPLGNSPCIDAGNPSNITATTDLAGSNRTQGTQIDIGAYESGFDVGLNYVSENKISVFPNPFVKELHLSDIEGIQQIRLLDVTGRVVEHFAPKPELIITKELQVGVYFLEMDYGSYREVAKLERL